MIALRVNDTWLRLPKGLSLSVDKENPAFSDEIPGDFSLPVEVPVEGNEVALGHAHELALKGRLVTLDNAQVHYKGLMWWPGKLVVMGATESSVKISFSVAGFALGLKDQDLSDIDFGEAIDVSGDTLVVHAATQNESSYPDVDYVFPMYRNADLYGEANPVWWRTGSAWSSTSTYDEFDVVEFEEDDAGNKAYYMANQSTSAGESPSSHASKWDLLEQGFVNNWDATNQEFRENAMSDDFSVNNQYAMSPCFFWKYVLAKLFETHGWTLGGEFMEDSDTDQVLLYNNYMLDAKAGLHFYGSNASQALPGSGTSLPIPLDTSPAPAQDPNSDWDNVANSFTFPRAGVYKIYLYFDFQVDGSDDNELYAKFAGAGPIFIDGTTVEANSGSLEKTVIVDVPDLSGFPTHWEAGLTFDPTYNFDYTVSNVVLRIDYLSHEDLNTYAEEIVPANHMLNMSQEEFLLATRTKFNLRLDLDPASKEAKLQYNKNTLMDFAPAEDISELVIGELLQEYPEHGGARFVFDADDITDGDDLPDLSNKTHIGDFTFELPYPTAQDEYTVLLTTRHIYISELKYVRISSTTFGESYRWVKKGYLHPDLVKGAGEETVNPVLSPLMMDYFIVEGKAQLIPVISEEGNSQYFAIGNKEPGLRAAIWHGLQENADGNDYPLASPYRYAQDGTAIGTIELVWDGARGLFEHFWREWFEFLTNSERAVADVDLSEEQVLQHTHPKRYHYKGQHYLVMRMPVELGEVLRCNGVELIKIPNE